MSHTKEPWHTGGDGTIIYDSEGWAVANAKVFHSRHNGPEEAKNNASRIVACVNACSGIDTFNLELWDAQKDFGPNWLDGIKLLIIQRDKLLDALKQSHMSLIGYLPGHRNEITDAAIEAASSAIAAVEGGA